MRALMDFTQQLLSVVPTLQQQRQKISIIMIRKGLQHNSLRSVCAAASGIGEKRRRSE